MIKSRTHNKRKNRKKVNKMITFNYAEETKEKKTKTKNE